MGNITKIRFSIIANGRESKLCLVDATEYGVYFGMRCSSMKKFHFSYHSDGKFHLTQEMGSMRNVHHEMHNFQREPISSISQRENIGGFLVSCDELEWTGDQKADNRIRIAEKLSDKDAISIQGYICPQSLLKHSVDDLTQKADHKPPYSQQIVEFRLNEMKGIAGILWLQYQYEPTPLIK